jgi:hypothetical protein
MTCQHWALLLLLALLCLTGCSESAHGAVRGGVFVLALLFVAVAICCVVANRRPRL